MFYLGELSPQPDLSRQAAERYAQLSALRTTKSKPSRRPSLPLRPKTA